jgi:hypothetical protein
MMSFLHFDHDILPLALTCQNVNTVLHKLDHVYHHEIQSYCHTYNIQIPVKFMNAMATRERLFFIVLFQQYFRFIFTQAINHHVQLTALTFYQEFFRQCSHLPNYMHALFKTMKPLFKSAMVDFEYQFPHSRINWETRCRYQNYSKNCPLPFFFICLLPQTNEIKRIHSLYDQRLHCSDPTQATFRFMFEPYAIDNDLYLEIAFHPQQGFKTREYSYIDSRARENRLIVIPYFYLSEFM